MHSRCFGPPTRLFATAIARAARLDDLVAGGRVAQTNERTIRNLIRRADTELADRPGYHDVVVAALSAQAATLQAMASLSTLTPQTLGRWNATHADVTASLPAVAETRRKAALVLPPGLPPDRSNAATRAVTSVDDLVSGMQRKLRRWRKRYERARRERRQRLAVLDSYARSMRDYLGTYDELRDELSTFMAKVDSSGVTFDDAYDFLAEASGARSRVRNGIAALDAPAALATTHNELLAVVDTGVAAVDAAWDGTADYEFDFEGEYDHYRDTPGWQSFTRDSEAIASRYAAARGSWQSQVDAARKRVRDRRIPTPPEV
jgi:hypothetical protein